ncbi:CASP-like protein 5B3 isoform X2 [Magnolia sinica]|uniref:CASP-like protein 5B3 isoform X2 n=1 Tax=Magnolia sinica TaxID=86752 RepID=UPI0026595F79|nr:CASP-like protein 5B3 isoform X2 [Magnolia sinica]XP_058109473.1 CASP-like protein 5B3 isoform X2 [Magnolia sinica]
MKDLLGSPGTISGLLLRIWQCLFAAASIVAMVSGLGFSSFTAFCYLIASMGLQVLWSFGLACLDVYALRIKRDLQNPVLVSLFVVGDWISNATALEASGMEGGDDGDKRASMSLYKISSLLYT